MFLNGRWNRAGLALAVLAIGLLAGCRPAQDLPQTGGETPQVTPGLDEATAIPTPEITTEPDETPGSTGYRPVSAEACGEIQTIVDQTLNTVTEQVDAPFEDFITQETGTGCRVTITGTGADFGNFVDVANNLKSAFQALGWVDDPIYIADGPTGTVFAVRQGNALAIVSVSWEADPAADCPTDQPIAECQLSPEQQLFNITVDIAEK